MYGRTRSRSGPYALCGRSARRLVSAVNWVADPTFTTQVNYEYKTPCLLECRPPLGPAADIAPGGRWPELDVHSPGPEEVFVARGTFNDGERDHPEGSFIHCPAGSSHWPQSQTGCRLFVLSPHG